MTRNQNQSNNKPYGLFLAGNIVERTRRHVPKEKPTTEIVTYTLTDHNDHKYYVDDFAPDSYHELGEYVCFQIYVKPYLKKNGDVSYNLCIQKRPSSRGEHF